MLRFAIAILMTGCAMPMAHRIDNPCELPTHCRDYISWAYCPLDDGTWWITYPSGEAVHQAPDESTFVEPHTGEVISGETLCHIEARAL